MRALNILLSGLDAIFQPYLYGGVSSRFLEFIRCTWNKIPRPRLLFIVLLQQFTNNLTFACSGITVLIWQILLVSFEINDRIDIQLLQLMLT